MRALQGDRHLVRTARQFRLFVISVVALLATILGASGAETLRTHFITSTYGANAGLPLPIEDIVQTRDGYLWMATEAGLARFDGVRFSVYRTSGTPGLRYNGIRALFEDSSGQLWIGTERGLSIRRNDTFEEIGSADVSFGTFAEDRQGVIWIGSDRGLWQYRDGVLKNLEQEPLVAGKTVRFLFSDRAGRIWIIASRTLLCYEGNAFRVFEHQGAALENVVAVNEARDGTLWFATSTSGVLRLQGGELKQFGTEQGLASNIASQVFIDQHENVWVIAAGVHLLRPDEPDRFFAVLPRAYENFQPIAEDREGNIWLGTHSEGLIRVTPTSLQAYSEEHGLPVGSVRSVTEDHSGNLWVSLVHQPLMSIAPDGTVKTHDPADGYGEDSYAEFTAADGSTWHGCKRGLQVIRNGQLEVFPQYPHVRAIFQERGGAIWFGPDGPAVRYQNGVFEEIGGHNGMPDGAASCFAEGPDGEVYVGFRKEGLAVWQRGAVTLHNTDTGLPTNTVRGLLADREGNIWIGFKGRGLALLSEGKWLNPEAFSELFQDQVSAIVEDDHGNLFLGTLKGVFHAKKADVLAMAHGGPAAHFYEVVLSDGVRSDEVSASAQPAVWKARNGVLWFATRQGLFGIDPARLNANNEPPPVYIERAQVDHHLVAVSDRLTLPHGSRTLQIDYTGLGFTRPEQVRFKYKLIGYDDDWVDAGTRRTAYYTRLQPGAYRFQVVACNNDGVWNETGASLEVVQQPWFYQTSWFRGLLVSGLIVSTLGLYRWRVRQVNQRARTLEQQNTQLEERIGERTAELAKSNVALRTSEYFYHSLVESLPQIIVRKDVDGRFTYANEAFAALVDRSLCDIIGSTDGDLFPAEAADKYRADDVRVMQTKQPIEFESIVQKEGQPKVYLHVKKVPLMDDAAQSIGVLILFWDMTVFRETEDKLKIAQRELVETSRLAGMAELATNILHNLGNALNSVNTSAGLAAERVRAIQTSGISKLAQLLREQGDRIAEFFATDPRAASVTRYLEVVANGITQQRDDAVTEISAMQVNIDQINGIVADQQKHASAAGIEETVFPTELIEYALSIKAASLKQHNITVTREFMPTPAVKVQRQKALQILLHLLRNAEESVGLAEREEKRLTIALRMSDADQVAFMITDNGVGVASQNLTRIFNFGYTTKATGHGYSLHTSALAAREMQGSLIAQSPGLGLGATFSLTLPADRGIASAD